MNCSFVTNTRTDMIYFDGHRYLRLHNNTLNLDECVVVDKMDSYCRDYFYLKTHRYKDGKPVYLRIPTSYNCYVDVTEYFDNVL